MIDAISVGVDRMQRNFEPMRRQVETWRAQQLTSATAKLIIYRAFIEIGVDRMQRNFEPMRRQVEEWRSRQISTVAAKLMFRATAKLSGFLQGVRI